MAHQKRHLDWCAIKNTLRLYSCEMYCCGSTVRAKGPKDGQRVKVHAIRRRSDTRLSWAAEEPGEYSTAEIIERIKRVSEGGWL